MATAFVLAYAYLWRFTGYIGEVPFWLGFSWLFVLWLLVLVITVARILSPPPSKLRTKTGLILKPGAGLLTWSYALISGALLITALLAERESLFVRGYLMFHMVLLALYIALMGWKLVEYYIGLPANAGIKAAHNAERLEAYIEEINFYAASDWLSGGRGVTAKGRLRATLGWWTEELNRHFPGRGLEMALPAVTLFLENINRDVTLIGGLYERQERAKQNLEDAELRILDAIMRTERTAGRLQA